MVVVAVAANKANTVNVFVTTFVTTRSVPNPNCRCVCFAMRLDIY